MSEVEPCYQSPATWLLTCGLPAIRFRPVTPNTAELTTRGGLVPTPLAGTGVPRSLETARPPRTIIGPWVYSPTENS
jgi:hypothetical protein